MARGRQALVAVGAGLAGLLIVRTALASRGAGEIRQVVRHLLENLEPDTVLLANGFAFERVTGAVELAGKPPGMDPAGTGGRFFGPIWPAEWDRQDWWWVEYSQVSATTGAVFTSVLQLNTNAVPVDVYPLKTFADLGLK